VDIVGYGYNMSNVQNLINDIAKLVKAKQDEYGHVDIAVNKFLQTVYPNGITTDKYDDVLFAMRIIEKLSRVCSSNISLKAKDDAYQDIVGYGLLGLNMDKKGKTSED
jgi:hypothetical protein